MKRLFALLVLLGLLAPMLLLPEAASATPSLDGVVTQGTPEYENVLDAIAFLKQMGNTDRAQNLEEWLKKGKVKWHTGGDPGATGLTGNISARDDFINPSTAQDNAGNRVSINKSALKDMDKFEMIAKLAAVLLHEKVHAHQPDFFIVGSNLHNMYGGGPNVQELIAWRIELNVVDGWILNLVQAKDYEKAIALIRMKVDNINSLLGTGYAAWPFGYGYGKEDIDRLEAQKKELEQLVAQQKAAKNELLEDLKRMQEEKERLSKEAIANMESSAPFAESRPLAMRLGQLPSGPAATVGNLVVGRVVNINLELDRTTRERDMFTMNAKFTRETEGLTMELRPGKARSASLSLKARESTLGSVVKAPDPVGALLLALRTGDITYSGSLAFPLKLALGMAPSSADQFKVSAGQSKTVQYQGTTCSLQLNALGTRTLTPSGSNEVIAVDRYGGVLGQSTTAIQKLLANSPKGISPSAGLLTKPANSLKLAETQGYYREIMAKYASVAARAQGVDPAIVAVIAEEAKSKGVDPLVFLAVVNSSRTPEVKSSMQGLMQIRR